MMDTRTNIIWKSLLLTILIFSIGIILNHVIDYVRIDSILDVMSEHELERDAYQVEYLFAESFDENTCKAMNRRIKILKSEMRKVGEDLGSYSRFSFFKRKDFDYLKRKYFLLQLRFYTLIKRVNQECGDPYVPILFFYQIDEEDSERQGFMLEEVSKSHEKTAVVLSLDWEYEDEPLVDMLVKAYNVTTTPTIIIGDTKLEGLTYTGVINATYMKTFRRADPFADNVNFDFTLNAAGANKSVLIPYYLDIMTDSSADPFARGDAALIVGRLTDNDSMICRSLEFFDNVSSDDPEVMAITYETVGSLGCGRNRNVFYELASKMWKLAGNDYRSFIIDQLATGFLPDLKFDNDSISAEDRVISGYFSPILPNISKTNSSSVIIGSTTLIFPKNSTFLTQTDRVHRDWLGGQINNPFSAHLLQTFSERLHYNFTDLRPDIGWHEGGRTADFVEHGFNYTTAVGTLVAKHNDRWFAVDDDGTFRFEVPIDKLLYPTTRFVHEDLAVIIDSHGVNMLVEQSLRKNVSFVLSDCDHPGKVYAAKYLSDRGIPVVCYPDKYVYLALGHNLSLTGSAPVTFTNNTAIIGNSPVLLNSSSVIVAVNATDSPYALWYYQTPTSYFEHLTKSVPLNVHYYTIDSYDDTSEVVDFAGSINASVIAGRLFSRNDYYAYSDWLSNSNNSLILFHSASYPYTQILMRDFPDQISFDDPNPVIV